MKKHAQIPLEFANVLEALGEESQKEFNKREVDGQPFWEGNEELLKKAAQTKAAIFLENRFKTSRFLDRVFSKSLFGKKIRKELTNSRYVSFERVNSDAPSDRQKILLRINLPKYFQEVVQKGK